MSSLIPRLLDHSVPPSRMFNKPIHFRPEREPGIGERQSNHDGCRFCSLSVALLVALNGILAGACAITISHGIDAFVSQPQFCVSAIGIGLRLHNRELQSRQQICGPNAVESVHHGEAEGQQRISPLLVPARQSSRSATTSLTR
jgi:hypothetical protein